MESFEVLNQRLADIYGRTTVGNHPKYRVAFTSTEFEKRIGTFEDYYGHIFIRRVHECRLVPKYPRNPDRIVLEYFQWTRGNPELTTEFSYEPIFFYEAKGGGFYRPNWRGLVVVIDSHLAGLEGRSPREVINRHLEEEKEKEDSEAQYIMDVLGEEMRSPLFESESAVSYSGLDGRPNKGDLPQSNFPIIRV